MSALVLTDKFWSRTKREGKCLVWTGAKYRRGYGHVNIGGAHYATHRAVWINAYGPIPEGIDICHHCDNPPCCLLEHLFSGSASENMKDCYQKGRGLPRERPARGERNGASVLTEGQVRQIRELRSQGMYFKEIGQRFGIDESAARNIVKRKRWAHVE